MPRSKVDPGRPSENSPYRSLCMGFWAFEAIAVCFWTVLTADSLSGLYQASGSAVFPVACAVPCVRFSLYCSKPPFSFTTATLGMNGWLDLIHQGLSPWKRSPGFPWRTKSRVACMKVSRASVGFLIFMPSTVWPLFPYPSKHACPRF
jgi:hypothetical protein